MYIFYNSLIFPIIQCLINNLKINKKKCYQKHYNVNKLSNLLYTKIFFNKSYY